MPETWVTTEDVAAHLGKPVSWIHQNAERIGLPRRRLGNHFRYRLSQVDAWLAEQS